jgi:hypothetical protein
MNQRERFLTVGLLALIVLGGGAFLFHFLFWQPLENLKSRIASVRRELDTKEKERDTLEKERQKILHVDPRLGEWRKISLPESPGRTPDEINRQIPAVGVKYEQFLSRLLRRNGFASSLTVSSKAPDSKSSPTLPGRGPMYTRLGFSVTGQAPYEAVVKALKEFHDANLLHEVRTLSLIKPETRRQGGREGDLEVKMDVEALLVAGADKRSADDLLPDSTKTPKPQVLAGRQYEDLMAHNVFLGRSVSTQLTEDRREVLGTVKLTSLINSGDRWEGYLLEWRRGKKETKIKTSAGWNEFVIRDLYKNVVLKAKVIRLDDRDVLFQADGKFYRLHLGQDLYTALETPLKEEEVKSLGLVAAAP